VPDTGPLAATCATNASTKASKHAIASASASWPISRKTDDPLFGRGVVRADGRKIHDWNLFPVTSPAESRYAWDHFKRLQTVPGDAAFRPLEAGVYPWCAAADRTRPRP
jgi:hypothetical protein